MTTVSACCGGHLHRMAIVREKRRCLWNAPGHWLFRCDESHVYLVAVAFVGIQLACERFELRWFAEAGLRMVKAGNQTALSEFVGQVKDVIEEDHEATDGIVRVRNEWIARDDHHVRCQRVHGGHGARRHTFLQGGDELLVVERDRCTGILLRWLRSWMRICFA